MSHKNSMSDLLAQMMCYFHLDEHLYRAYAIIPERMYNKAPLYLACTERVLTSLKNSIHQDDPYTTVPDVINLHYLFQYSTKLFTTT